MQAAALGAATAFAASALLSAAFLHEAAGRLRLMRRTGRPLMIAAGVMMVAMGIAMITGKLTTFSYWLLERFPALGRIG